MTTADDLRAALVRALARAGDGSSDFDLDRDGPPPAPDLRGAAVLVPFIELDGEVRVILTKRAAHLSQHPGQIAFPGGKIDAADADARAAALREAQEEIGLPPDGVRVLGNLPAHRTVTGYTVTPVLGWIAQRFDMVPEPGEVSEVFSVPWAHLADTAHFSVEARLWRGTLRRYDTVPYGPYYIWGATARILRGLADAVAA